MSGEGFAYFRWHQLYWEGAVPYCLQLSNWDGKWWHVCRHTWGRKTGASEEDAMALAKGETDLQPPWRFLPISEHFR